MSDTVQAPRTELQQCVDHLRAMQATIQEILDRPVPPTRGHIEFGGGAVIPLPDEGPYDPRD